MFWKLWESSGVQTPRGGTTCPHLLDPRDGHLLCHIPCFALSGKIIVHFAGTEEKSLDVFWVLGCRAIFWDHPLEVGTYKRIPTAGALLRTWLRVSRALPPRGGAVPQLTPEHLVSEGWALPRSPACDAFALIHTERA